MSEVKHFSMVKTTVNTPLHIDFDWWQSHDHNWMIYLHSCLCPEHQETFANAGEKIQIDWVDPETAEVHTVDGLQHILMTHCAKQPGFITSNTALVDSVFRVFLANGNTPQTPTELSEVIGRPAETILRTLAGAVIYKGIRPVGQTRS